MLEQDMSQHERINLFQHEFDAFCQLEHLVRERGMSSILFQQLKCRTHSLKQLAMDIEEPYIHQALQQVQQSFHHVTLHKITGFKRKRTERPSKCEGQKYARLLE